MRQCRAAGVPKCGDDCDRDGPCRQPLNVGSIHDRVSSRSSFRRKEHDRVVCPRLAKRATSIFFRCASTECGGRHAFFRSPSRYTDRFRPRGRSAGYHHLFRARCSHRWRHGLLDRPTSVGFRPQPVAYVHRSAVNSQATLPLDTLIYTDRTIRIPAGGPPYRYTVNGHRCNDSPEGNRFSEETLMMNCAQKVPRCPTTTRPRASRDRGLCRTVVAACVTPKIDRSF